MQPTISKVYNLIILDESGSMEAIRQPTINGFNEIIQSIRHSALELPGIKQYINLFSFNGAGVKQLIPVAEAEFIPVLTNANYHPDNDTPLYDAIGHAVNHLRSSIEKEKNFSVLVTILTDGEENASKEYDFHAVSALVQNMRQHGWVFTYIGANHNVEQVAMNLNINNHMVFETSAEGTDMMAKKNIRSRKKFMEKLSSGLHDVSENFFTSE